MHKVVIAPDSFKGVLSAREVCDIISYKINRHYPFCQIVKVPVADGGEGSIEAFLCAKNGKKIFCDVKGANGETLNCYFGIFEKTAVVEVAQAVGLSLPTRAPALSGTTYGVGQLIGQAVKMGVEKILLCLGGTSTVDAGCGMAAALGAKFYDKEFREFLPVGKNLCEIRSVDFSAMRRLLGLVRINVLYDVDCKLCGDEGAAAVFGPQKGLTPSEISFADKNLAHFAEVVGQACGFRPEEIKGGGAAGGMGAGAKAFFNADMNRGIDAVLETINFNSHTRRGFDYYGRGAAGFAKRLRQGAERRLPRGKEDERARRGHRGRSGCRGQRAALQIRSYRRFRAQQRYKLRKRQGKEYACLVCAYRRNSQPLVNR